MISLELKHKVHARCAQVIEQEIEWVKDTIKELRISSQNDTKSSAGDKHETSRAMVDLEIQKQEIRLRNIIEKREALSKIDPNNALDQVKPGALVQTETQIFYISTSLGAIEAENLQVIALSPEAPLASKMKALKLNSSFDFRGKVFTIAKLV